MGLSFCGTARICSWWVRHLSYRKQTRADWERSLQAPAARQAKQQAAQEDARAVQGADALAKQVDQLASGVLLGIGRRLAQAQVQVPCCPARCQAATLHCLQTMDMAYHTNVFGLSCW